jgi:type II secretory pathway pseudopilin PulG
VAIIAGVWSWRQRTTRQQAEQAQQEVLQQMQREGTQY